MQYFSKVLAHRKPLFVRGEWFSELPTLMDGSSSWAKLFPTSKVQVFYYDRFCVPHLEGQGGFGLHKLEFCLSITTSASSFSLADKL